MKKILLTIGLTIFLTPAIALAGGGYGTSSGLILLNDSNARSLALSGAVAADKDDISAFGYNPASLASLSSVHASILYEAGITDDSFSQIMAGKPFSHGTFGASLGYYNGGDFDLFDEAAGVANRNVTAQTDIVLGFGYGRQFEHLDAGATLKYISSELMEMESAQAFALDLGVAKQFPHNIRISGALQNFGTKLKYIKEGDDLPQLMRVSGAYGFMVRGHQSNVYLDIPYYMNEADFQLGLGGETLFGPLAIRLGYKTGIELGGLTAGAGFKLGQVSLDYGFGLMDEVDTRHRVSLSMRFGGTDSSEMAAAPREVPVVKAEAPPKPVVAAEEAPKEEDKAMMTELRDLIQNQNKIIQAINGQSEKAAAPGVMVYTVKPGDTLVRIAVKKYGNKHWWKKILAANRNVLDDVTDLKVGTKLILP